MSVSNVTSKPNKIALHFYKASKFFVIMGLPSFIKWRENRYTRTLRYKYMRKFITVTCVTFVLMELGSFFTQNNLSEQQVSEVMIVYVAHSLFLSYPFVMEHHEERVTELLNKLCITMKNVYNDPEVERQMIKKTTIYSVSFMLNLISAMISYAIDALMQAISPEGTFMPVITAWPDVTDTRTSAKVVRVVAYLMWWVFIIRIACIHVLVILTTGVLSYQFKNVQSYFYSLDGIFDNEKSDEMDHEVCEQKYEDAFKVGIRLHDETLWCTRQCQICCSVVYSAQMAMNVYVVSILMWQMVKSERSLSYMFSILLTITALIASTGILMWNAGDVTVEAALVPNAMYSSGWQHCRGRSCQRIGKLLVIAMSQAQIVKASYSAFSVIY